jgi:Domain of unknown function (DUF4440)
MYEETGRADEQAIRRILRRITTAWVDGPVEDMAGDLHPDVVMVQPGFAAALVGRADALASFASFAAEATIKRYRSTEPDIGVWGDTAVAWYTWRMTYALGGETLREVGHDLWVFARIDGRWAAVWRTLTAGPAPIEVPEGAPETND